MVTTVKPTAVGSVTYSHTIVLPTLAAKTRARRPRRTTAKVSPRRYGNNRRCDNGHSKSGQSCHAGSHNKVILVALKAVARRPNSLTAFKPQDGVPPAPSSDSHQAPGMCYGPAPDSNSNGLQRGTFRTS